MSFPERGVPHAAHARALRQSAITPAVSILFQDEGDGCGQKPYGEDRRRHAPEHNAPTEVVPAFLAGLHIWGCPESQIARVRRNRSEQGAVDEHPYELRDGWNEEHDEGGAQRHPPQLDRERPLAAPEVGHAVKYH
jgi:hypothetical protein